MLRTVAPRYDGGSKLPRSRVPRRGRSGLCPLSTGLTGGPVGALDCPRRGSGRRRAAAPMPEGLQTPRAKQNPGARRAPGFRKRTDLGPAHFFLAEDLEPPFDEPFEPDLEPPFAPPDFFAAVAMLVVLEASVILRREDDRTRLLNRNLIHKRRPELFRGFLGIAAKALVRTAAH